MELDWMQVVPWIAAIVFALAAAYLKFSGNKLDLYELQERAQEAVAAAQQLWVTEQIPEVNGVKDARFVYALARLQEYYPELSAETLEMTIEAAVYWLKQGVAQVQE